MFREILQKASLIDHLLGVWLLRQIGDVPILLVPISQNHRATGVFVVAGESLSQADRPALSLFARQVSVALENAQLFATEHTRQEELATLLELSQLLRGAQHASDILTLTLGETAEMFHSDFEMVSLYDSQTQQFKVADALGPISSNIGKVFGMESTCGMIYRTRQPYISPDYAQDAMRIDIPQAEEIGPAVFVPLESEVEFLGVLIDRKSVV